MSKGLEALWEYRLLVANYEDKWSKNTTEYFIECADIIEKELKALEIIIDIVDIERFIFAIARNQTEYDFLKEVLL